MRVGIRNDDQGKRIHGSALLKSDQPTQARLWYASLYFEENHTCIGIILLYPDVTNKKVIISTNGHYLDSTNSSETVKSGIYKLIVSLDGMDQSIFQNTG